MKKILTANFFTTNDVKNVLLNFKVWIQNSRTIALPQSVLPMITALSIATMYPQFNIYLAIIGIIGAIFGHLGSNLFDDYFDFKDRPTDYRDELAHKGIKARILKCEYITSGRNTINQLLAASVIFCGIALLMGFIIWLYRGNDVLYFAVLAAFFGLSYSGFPFKFSYRGLGEVVIGIMFGPLLMMGVHFAACGMISPEVVFLSIPVGMLVANIICTDSILDYEPDVVVNKRTLAVRLNNKTAMLVASFIFNFIPFAIIIVGVLFNYLSPWYLLVFLTFPMAINLFYLMIQYIKTPDKVFTPKFWMGPMGNWEEKVKYGIDWYMIRWFIARNCLSFFCLIITIVSIAIGIFTN